MTERRQVNVINDFQTNMWLQRPYKFHIMLKVGGIS